MRAGAAGLQSMCWEHGTYGHEEQSGVLPHYKSYGKSLAQGERWR